MPIQLQISVSEKQIEGNVNCAQLKVKGIPLFHSPVIIKMLPYIAVCKNINKSVFLYT